MTMHAWFLVGLLMMPDTFQKDLVEPRRLQDVASSTPDRHTIEGLYLCQGESPNGGGYRGIVNITRNKDAFNIIWLIGKEESLGVGILRGSTLSACCVTRVPQGIGVSTVHYRIEKDGRLIGQFTEVGGDGTLRRETLIPALRPK